MFEEAERKFRLPTRDGLHEFRQMYDEQNVKKAEPEPPLRDKYDYAMKVIVQAIQKCYQTKKKYMSIYTKRLFARTIGLESSLWESEKTLVRKIVDEMNDSGLYLASCGTNVTYLTFCILEMTDVPFIQQRTYFYSDEYRNAFILLCVTLACGPLVLFLLLWHHFIFCFIGGICWLSVLCIFGIVMTDQAEDYNAFLSLHVSYDRPPKTKLVEDKVRDTFDTFFN